MSPIRHEDDFRRREINDWDEYVQEEIHGAIGRGEFDNLPDKGKPIKIWRTELNPEHDLAFSRLKNAGVMPAWMELDAEVSRLSRELESFLDRSRSWLEGELERFRETVNVGVEVDTHDPGIPWWQFWRRIAAWWRFDLNETKEPAPVASVRDLVLYRDRMRGQYLERAAVLDKKIAEYHNALPRELSHLQQLRMLPERAGRIFDERIPVRMLVDASGTADSRRGYHRDRNDQSQ
jgi:hypothetical protein